MGVYCESVLSVPLRVFKWSEHNACGRMKIRNVRAIVILSEWNVNVSGYARICVKHVCNSGQNIYVRKNMSWYALFCKSVRRTEGNKLFQGLTIILKTIKEGLSLHSHRAFETRGVNLIWILKNSKDLLAVLQSQK